MTIYIDADACPVTRIAEGIAREYGIPVTLLCDTSHRLTSEYSTVKVIGEGADAVDLALINLCRRGDIVITQDYGVAALALGKGAKAIHQSGKQYTDENIDTLLMERHLARKARQSGKHHLKGPRKRTSEDDEHFAESFRKLLEESNQAMTKVQFYDTVEDEKLRFAVIVAKTNGQYVFCKHKERNTLEVPGGHREPGEDILATAKRELQEETGATEFTIRPVCVYSVTAPNNFDGQETFGMLYTADITAFEPELHSEIEKTVIQSELPENWTYPEIQPLLLGEIERRNKNDRRCAP